METEAKQKLNVWLVNETDDAQKTEATATPAQAQAPTRRGAVDFNNAEVVRIIKATICRDLTDNELFIFRNYCESTGLNPLRKEIRCWRDRASGGLLIQTGIDGFRKIAMSHPQYEGSSEPEFVFEGDGKTPVSCKVSVYRSDWRLPATATVWFEEVAKKTQSGNGSWERMPRLMLAKVAEAHAYRKAFPQELSGIYTDDEPIEVDYTATEHQPEPGSLADNINKARFFYSNLKLIELPEAHQKLAKQLLEKAQATFDEKMECWVSEVRIPKLERFEVKL
jgi:phage recombination protein Bet